jgi:hypothetical protein
MAELAPLAAERLVRRLVLIAVTASVVFTLLLGLSDGREPRTTLLRVAAILLAGIMAGKGFGWARWVLVLVSGLAALLAVVVTLTANVWWWQRIIYGGTGGVIVWSLWQLLTSQAAREYYGRAGTRKRAPNRGLQRPGAPAGPGIARLEGSMSRSLTIRIAWMALAPAAEAQCR